MTNSERTCQQCGVLITKWSSVRVKNKQLYCCGKCYNVAYPKSELPNSVKLQCQYCNCVFYEHKKAAVKRKYCSHKCHMLALKEIHRANCKYCGKEFHVWKSKIAIGRKYCSCKCMGLAQRGVNSPAWRGGAIFYYGWSWPTQRRLAYQRDGGVCQLCHRKPKQNEYQFHVHHIVKARRFNGDHEAANDLSNLITLCPQCHPKAEHGKIAVPVRLL